MQGWERAINTLSVRRPHPHNTNPWNARRERENSRRQKGNEQLRKKKGISPALETDQFHTIEYGVTKIVPQRYCQGNKSHAVLRSLQRGTKAPLVIRTGTCGPGKAP